MKKLNLKMKGIGEMLSKEQMKNVVGGEYSAEKCTVKVTCATGFVECSSDAGKCYKKNNMVQCDSAPPIYCS